MGNSYFVSDYMAPIISCTIGSMVLLGAVCIWLGRKLIKKYSRTKIAFVPILGYIVFLIILVTQVIPVFEQTGDLLVPSEYEIRTTAGTIDSIVPAEHMPLYIVNGKICGADHIVIDAVSYYTISDSSLSQGILVEVQYAHSESNVILQWQEVTQERAAQVLEEASAADLKPKEEAPPKVVSQRTQQICLVIYRLSLLGFVVYVAVTALCHQKIAQRLLAKDIRVSGQIIPNRAILLFYAPPLIFLVLIRLCLCIGSGEYNPLFILSLVGGGLLVFTVMTQLSYLKMDGSYLYVRQFGKEQQYRTADIFSVYWHRCRGFIPKEMVIRFCDGKTYHFSSNTYLGVENTFRALTTGSDSTPMDE